MTWGALTAPYNHLNPQLALHSSWAYDPTSVPYMRGGNTETSAVTPAGLQRLLLAGTYLRICAHGMGLDWVLGCQTICTMSSVSTSHLCLG